MDRVDPRTKQCRVEVHHDDEMRSLEDACGDGFTFGTGARNSTHHVREIPELAEGDQLFMLDVYEHGLVLYSLASNGPQCQWDTARGGAFIILHAEAGWNMDNAESIARGIAQNITTWANGDIYGFTVEDMTGTEIDSCWGIMDHEGDGIVEYVRSAIGDLAIAEVNETASDLGFKVAA